MTSQLNVDTIVDKAGSGGTNVKIANNSVTVSEGGSNTTTTVQGLCKMWTSFTGISTTAIKDSFNSSSLTDVTTGKTNVSITTNMNNANWSGVKYSNANTGDTFSNDFAGGLTNRSSSIMKHTSHDQSAGTDGLYNDVQVNGDLA